MSVFERVPTTFGVSKFGYKLYDNENLSYIVKDKFTRAVGKYGDYSYESQYSKESKTRTAMIINNNKSKTYMSISSHGFIHMQDRAVSEWSITQTGSIRKIDAKTKSFQVDLSKPIVSDPVSESLYVAFIGESDVPETNWFIGMMSGDSEYNAPYMFDSGLKLNGKNLWFNLGPIYGKPIICDLNGEFVVSYSRDLKTGKLVNSYIRTSFTPLHEKKESKEVSVIDPESKLKLFIKYYDPLLSGNIITQDEAVQYYVDNGIMPEDL